MGFFATATKCFRAGVEPAYVPILESAGYSLRIRQPNWHEHRMFKGPAADINLHVFSSD
jgi:hypothetical protein